MRSTIRCICTFRLSMAFLYPPLRSMTIFVPKPHSYQLVRNSVVAIKRLSGIAGSDFVSSIVSHEELTEKLESGDVTLIDVREPEERAMNGFIEGSVAIPLDALPTALSYSEDKFKEAYGIDKPGLEEELIFMCHAGVRSKLALAIARVAKYEVVREYADGWKGWKERINSN